MAILHIPNMLSDINVSAAHYYLWVLVRSVDNLRDKDHHCSLVLQVIPLKQNWTREQLT